MSFRRQLFLSLAVLVVVPAVIAALAIGRVVTANENAKADARLQAASRVSGVIESTANRRSAARAETLQEDRALRRAINTGRPSVILEALPAAVKRAGLVGVIAKFPSGRTETVGVTPAVGIANVKAPLGPTGKGEVLFTFAFQSAPAYVNEVAETGGVPVALVGEDGRVLAKSSTFPGDDAINLKVMPPQPLGRWRSAEQPISTLGTASNAEVVFALNPSGGTSPLASRLVLGVLAAFIIVGITLGFVLVRALRWRIETFLGAAEKLGRGDFSAAAQIPAAGHDEFAKLGRAFIGMARQLDQRVDQLERERERVQSSLLRLGKAFAANLDRDTLVELVVESAVDGLTADAGRALMPSGPGGTPETRGSFGAVLDSWDALGEVERRALATGTSATAEVGELHAIAEPMQVERGDGPLGVISVARMRPFDPGERELLAYLTEQAAVSLRNVGRHEDVARESITDELTGLANRRRFDDVLAHAAARATNEDPIALVMLDLDRFKVINDTHGHPFGDKVLKAVARVVRETARDRDLPARYGGEELAVVLATGDTEAARHFAERLRLAIEALELGDDTTGAVPVTASLGVASLPSDGDDVGDLVRAADEALYRAKRGGRNRVESASPAKGPAGEVR
ncbi:MAG: diguanylate cyclase [Solirubrobacteraceae bacterium]|nr:diguanylate cyclase [Solirubrobacteraceae bacterium]